MNKQFSLKNTDLCLMLTFPVILASGLMLHAIGHEHFQAWKTSYAWIHITAAVLLVILAGRHIYQHKAWFKSLFSKFKSHNKITVLTAFFLIPTVLTGVFVPWSDESSHLRIVHYQSGIVFSVFAVLHFAKRLRTFRKLK